MEKILSYKYTPKKRNIWQAQVLTAGSAHSCVILHQMYNIS